MKWNRITLTSWPTRAPSSGGAVSAGGRWWQRWGCYGGLEIQAAEQTGPCSDKGLLSMRLFFFKLTNSTCGCFLLFVRLLRTPAHVQLPFPTCPWFWGARALGSRSLPGSVSRAQSPPGVLPRASMEAKCVGRGYFCD
ncbi:hypothetical protein KIL84_023493 [Mauremys mutica]|uniref:Uncharacterized protein n=1 Tax=Mauremys mutica TaxID=74926 RepID=A0A9D3WQ44_9SAUR|nr:hypothetical protein KIL84_023493 [Mauremys mutica]